ncbi:MAG: methylated-DNA--[protein]-cysteine S-methyltransferase [Vicinamibacterales bacterium]|jgi:methylated-DNA-[protein]-cysteine S-methyltransferase|nr:methylated-DNA--[protein]-cysteine S-methyltransferase [Vicinamibacterales bacterium]
MTCDAFASRLDQLVTGDLRESTGRAMERHAAGCDACGVKWGQVVRLREMLEVVAMNDTDTSTAIDAEPEATVVRQARARLRSAFDRAGHPVIRFGQIQTPVGTLFVGATDKGVCDVTFGQSSERRYRERLLRRSPEVRRDETGLTAVTEELTAYFAGELTRFSLQVDLRQVTPFTARVLRETQRIRFGQVSSYGELAARIGSPGASRAVGGALGRNPIPIIIPCHRVIAQGGRIGGFTGGLPTKRALLGLEGYCVPQPTRKLF